MFNYKSKVTELRESVILTRNVSVIFFLSALGIFFSAASPQEEAVLFADVVNVSKNSSTFPINHKVAVSGNNIFVIWADVPLGTNSSINSNNSNSDFNLQEEIYFTKSVDGGNNFGPIVNLSNKNGSSNIPYIASSENHVYAIWQDDSGIEGNQKIYLTKSVDVGNSFGPVMNLSNGTGSSSNPQIVASEQDVYVVWQADNSAGQENQEIYFIKSVDGGNSFGPVLNLSNTNDGDSRDPKISILRSGSGEREEEKNNNGTSLYFVWTECISEEDEPSCDIFFTKSVDGGNSFGPVLNLSNGTGSSFNPQIDVSSAAKPNSSNTVYVVWQDESFTSSGNYDIFLTKSTDGGNSFGGLEAISKTDSISRHQRVTTGLGNVYIVWSDVDNNSIGNSSLQGFDIFFTKSTDSGKSFGPVMNLSNGTGSSSNPQIVASEQDVYVVWQENDPRGNQEIYYIQSTDGGTNFGNKYNLSNNIGASLEPTMNVAMYHAKKTVYVLWQDDTTGAPNIFLRYTDN